MFKLSLSSKEIYDTLHSDLRRIIDLALLISPVDFKLVEGYRSPEEQFKLYKKGRIESNGIWRIINHKKVVTYIDGINKKSKHNYNPSLAVDVAAYVPGHPELTYDEKHMIAVGSAIVSAANLLYKSGKILHKIRWGADWDGDHELIYDQALSDIPHIELVENE